VSYGRWLCCRCAGVELVLNDTMACMCHAVWRTTPEIPPQCHRSCGYGYYELKSCLPSTCCAASADVAPDGGRLLRQPPELLQIHSALTVTEVVLDSHCDCYVVWNL
jgi:hypothetical protein